MANVGRRARLTSTIFLAVMTPGLAQHGDQIRVGLPDWSQGGTCSVAAAVGGAAAAFQHEVLVSCGGDDRLVSCGGGNVEPLAVSVSDICRTGTVRFMKAEYAWADTTVPTDVTLEWMTLSEQGRTTLLASGIASLPGAIPVADVDDRVVRFLRSGSSPVTVTASDLLREKTWSLPVAVPGGELVWRVESAIVVPVSYYVSGRRKLAIRRDGRRIVSVPGLPPGEYQIATVYEGGLVGSTRVAHVNTGESAFVFLENDLVGAADISGSSTGCLDSVELSILLAETKSTVLRARGSDCRWRIAGLSPGTYEAVLRARTGSAGRQRFTITAQTVTEVAVPSPTVQVAGIVLLKHEPVNDATLAFEHAQGAMSTTTTDASGRYLASLDKAGEYRVVLRAASTTPKTRKITLIEGWNDLDWSIPPGGTLTIDVRGGRADTPITVLVESRSSSKMDAIGAGEQPRIEKTGLEFETYHVSAAQGNVGVSREVKAVVLTEEHPEAVVEVELVESRSVLTITDPMGALVRQASIRPISPSGLGPVGRAPREMQPGVYALDGLPPGTQLRIRSAGFAPVCRTVRLNENVSATLTEGRPLTLQLPTGMTLADMALIRVSGLAGSDCPLNLADLEPKLLVAPSRGQAITVAIDHSPGALVTIQVDGQSRRDSVKH